MLGKLLKSQRGDVAIAILVSIVALMSGLSLSMIAGRDANAALYQSDQVQELSLLRSELRRGNVASTQMNTSASSMTMPIRYIQIASGGARTTYAMKTKIGRGSVPAGMAHATRRGIQSKVKAFRRPAAYVSYNSTTQKSPIETYGVKFIQQQTFAGYMYLSDKDTSVNDDQVYFYGYDEIYGRVHSNTDIWLKNFGGWPLFHDHVSTAGQMQYANGTPDPDEVFLDGYTEDAGTIEFNPTADLIRSNGGVMWVEYDLAFVELIERDYNAYLAVIENEPPESLIVYNMYPPYDDAVGDSLMTNIITFQETLWFNGGSGSIEGGSRMIEAGELWICGTCRGEQTWGSAGNMKLVSDILYANTDKGDAPDGYNGEPENREDYLGLVSERQILIQYGLVDPRDTLRHHYNVGSDDEGIWIYGALAALGDGDGDSHQDGIFSFEYQYPHRGTPAVVVGGELFDHVDLHLCKWLPQAPMHYWPWPARGGGGFSYAPMGDPGGPDYPWYNPLWPEWTPYKERGKIHIFGSVAQVRRGFVHRSGGDVLDTGWWDPPNYRYGPPPAFGQNAPGADGSGTGYDKDYHYDYRFMDNPPPDYPPVSIEGRESLFEGLALRFQRPPTFF